MEDMEVMSIANRNHQTRRIMEALDSDLEIFILKCNLDAIKAKRRRGNVSKMSLLWRKLRSL